MNLLGNFCKYINEIPSNVNSIDFMEKTYEKINENYTSYYSQNNSSY